MEYSSTETHSRIPEGPISAMKRCHWLSFPSTAFPPQLLHSGSIYLKPHTAQWDVQNRSQIRIYIRSDFVIIAVKYELGLEKGGRAI